MKTCTKCARELPLADFYMDRGKPRGSCKDCTRSAVRAYKKANPERVAETMRKWRASDEGRVTLARLSLARSRTPEFRAKVREWDKTPAGTASRKRRMARWERSEKGKATRRRIQAKRRSNLADVESTLTADEWSALLTEHGDACAYCRRPFTVILPPQQDHVVPVSKGGPHTKDNVVPACKPCNSSKKDRTSWEPKSSSTPPQSPPTLQNSSSR